MSNRAKFLLARSAHLPANQKTNSGILLFQWGGGVFVTAAYLCVIIVPAILLYSSFSYREEVAIAPAPIIENVTSVPKFVPSKAVRINLVTEQAEQETEAVAQNVDPQLWPDFGSFNETYQGSSCFWSEPIIRLQDCWSIIQVATAMFACGIFGILQLSKVQQTLRFIRRRIAFQLGFTSRGGSAAFRNRRKGQISYLTKHFFDQQLVRVALCLIMIAPVAAVFCLSQPTQTVLSAQSISKEQERVTACWPLWSFNQSKFSNFVADWQASPYGDASAAAHVARVNWPGVFLHVATVLWAILTEWRLVVPMVLMLLFFRSARQAKVTGRRSNLKQNLRQLSQYFLPVAQRTVSANSRSVPAVSRLVSGKQSLRQVAAPVLQISGKQQRFAQWKIKLKQRALH
ncbi:hypothetical protein KBI23_23420 [bacterium]|nr:hypothetical protein [bacterium]MBP9807529.1 hypothetical protein [bacterium]